MSAGRSSRKRFIRSLRAAHARRPAGRRRASCRRSPCRRCTPKYSCAPPGARRKPTNTSSKISTMPRSRADLAQPLQPLGVGRAVEVRAARRCRPAPSRPARSRSGCSACSGLTSTQAMSRRVRSTRSVSLRHVRQRVGLARRQRIADARLHVAPPAVVGAAEAHEVRAAACDSAPAAPPASPPRCRTCGTTLRRGRRSARSRSHVVGDHRVVGAEHRAEVAHALGAARRCSPCRSRSRTR